MVNRKHDESWQFDQEELGRWNWTFRSCYRMWFFCFLLFSNALKNLAYLDDPQCALGNLRFCLGAPKMVYSLRCNSPLDESIKILRKLDWVQRATFKGILGVLLSDTSWHQVCLQINKTGVGIRRKGSSCIRWLRFSIHCSCTKINTHPNWRHLNC